MKFLKIFHIFASKDLQNPISRSSRHIQLLSCFLLASSVNAALIQQEIDGARVCEGATLVHEYTGPVPLEKLNNAEHAHIIASDITFMDNTAIALPQLLYLAIQKSNLSNIPEGMLDTLFPNLNKLVLENNTIQNFKIEDLNALKNLETLEIRGQDIGSLKINILSKLRKLKHLSLTSAEITSIDNDAFQGLDNLEVLDLSNNQLKVIPKEALVPLNKLKRLILNDNKLGKLGPDDIPKLPELEEIQFKNNNELVNIGGIKTKYHTLTRIES